MDVVSARVEILNAMGIHLRPASSMVQACNEYPECEVELSKDGQFVNGRSLLSVIMLAAEMGSVIDIKVSGPGAQDLLAELVDLIENKFGEE